MNKILSMWKGRKRKLKTIKKIQQDGKLLWFPVRFVGYLFGSGVHK